MSPVDLFAALTGSSGSNLAPSPGAAKAGTDFLSVLASLQAEVPAVGDQPLVDARAGGSSPQDLKGALLSGAAVFMGAAAPVAATPPAPPAADAETDAEGDADAPDQPPVPGGGDLLAGGPTPDEETPAFVAGHNRGSAPASAVETAGSPPRAPAPAERLAADRQAPSDAARTGPGAGEPQTIDARPAPPPAARATDPAEDAAFARVAEAASPARPPPPATTPVPVPPAPPARTVPGKLATAAVEPAAPVDPEAPARPTASTVAPAPVRPTAAGAPSAQPPATTETVQQVRQQARTQGEVEAETRHDHRQARMASTTSHNSESGSAAAAPAPAGVSSPAAPAAASPSTPAARADSAGPAPLAPEAPPPAAPEPIPADSLEAAAEAETVRLQEAAAAQKSAAGSQLSRATVETTALIASQIIRRLDGRATRFDMALTPAGLGRVDVRVEIDSDGRLAARLAFDNPAAAADLRGRADELRRELQEAGFHLADDALDFSDRDQGSTRHAFEREDRAFRGAGRLNAEADEAVIPPAPGRWRSLTMTPQGVDMKV